MQSRFLPEYSFKVSMFSFQNIEKFLLISYLHFLTENNFQISLKLRNILNLSYHWNDGYALPMTFLDFGIFFRRVQGDPMNSSYVSWKSWHLSRTKTHPYSEILQLAYYWWRFDYIGRGKNNSRYHSYILMWLDTIRCLRKRKRLFKNNVCIIVIINKNIHKSNKCFDQEQEDPCF